MRRLAILFSALAAPAFGQSAPIDPIEDRPGRWISMQSEEAVATPRAADEDPAVDLSRLIGGAPDSSQVLGPVAPLPSARPLEEPSVLVLPEAAPLLPMPEAPEVLDATAIDRALITPRPPVPATRPIPNPRAGQVADLSDPVREAETSTARAPVAAPALPDPAPSALVEGSVAQQPVDPLPVEIPAVANVPEAAPDATADTAPFEDPEIAMAPVEAPDLAPASSEPSEGEGADPDDPALLAAALAEALAERAREIVVAGPRDVPQTPSDIGQLLHPVAVDVAVAEPRASGGGQPIVLIPPLEVDPAPLLDSVLGDLMAEALAPPPPQTPVALAALRGLTLGATLAPEVAMPALLQAVVADRQPPALARIGRAQPPVLPLQAHPAPRVALRLGPLSSPMIAQPSWTGGPSRMAAVARSAAMAAVELSGIDSVPQVFPTHEVSRDTPFALVVLPAPAMPVLPQRLAALAPEADVQPHRLPATGVLPRMSLGTPPARPDAARAWPRPDAGAVARLIEDTEICWRLADLSVEARWSDVYIDVALDAWNMPSSVSVRLTQQMDATSPAVQEAFRAAQAALAGCAMASDHGAATLATTLLFDRHGVHLR